MAAILVKAIVPDRILVSRESARLLERAIREQLQAGTGEIVVDFSEVAGIAPSFMDELIRVVEQIIEEHEGRQFVLRADNTPTRLSSKFEAIARGHGMSIQAVNGNSWELRPHH